MYENLFFTYVSEVSNEKPQENAAIVDDGEKNSAHKLDENKIQNSFRQYHQVSSTSTAVLSHSPDTFIALYSYKPQKPDEMELKKGCMIFIYLKLYYQFI